MKKIVSSLAMVTSVIFMTNCSNTRSAASTSSASEALSQNEWKLIEVLGAKVPSSSQAGLLFSPGTVNKVSGSTGCNRMTGTYETGTNNSIKFPPLATTRMACLDEGVNGIEGKFLEALSKATSWEISGNELLLKNGSAALATLKPLMRSSTEDVRLNGTWELNYISGSRIAFEGLFPNKKPTIIFNLPGTEVNGNSSCNGYSTNAKVDGHKMSFGVIAATMIACEGNGESDYFKTLKIVSSYSISDDNNVLTMMVGDIAVMRFARKPSTAKVVDGHNSRQSLDWAGSYRGILPCADCEGIETVIDLRNDLSFQTRRTYLGKKEATFYSKGSFTWNEDGNTITFQEDGNASSFLVGENKLFQLDKEGNRITGSLANYYVLTMNTPVITEKYWKLTEINGKPVPKEGNNHEPHIIIRTEGNRVTGNGGCNSLSGSYKLKDRGHITFSKIISTKMACPGLETEAQLFKILETVDSYILKEDTLILNKARMAVLARFEAVYLK